jgi:AbrB family transcriptional regulator (stage V sporulation protein T)
MKATGIVRRIDELGRVVIPKEIRRTLRIKEGDPLEIYTDRDELLLKKYSPIATLENFSKGVAEALNELCGYLVLICDTDTIICAVGSGKKDITGSQITEDLSNILTDRKSFISNKSDGGNIAPLVKGDFSFTSQIIIPIITNGDCIGGIIIVDSKEGTKLSSSEIKLAQLSAGFMAKQFD